MCAICGFVTKSPTSQVVLDRMTDSMKHRGPDDRGIQLFQTGKISYTSGNVGLGHRRLSIIDLSPAGHQPKCDFEQRYWITYNGEIYNYKEIRQKLKSKGRIFYSDSDTEVILQAYMEWNEDCFNKFEGMYSLAIYDTHSESLILARDRLGVKPLYYHVSNGNFLFASELKAFHENPLFQKEVDVSGLSIYLQYGYVPTPQTIFKDTFKLDPGSILVLNKDGTIRRSTYWNLMSQATSAVKLGSSEEEMVDGLESVLRKAFRYRMVSDVPVGVFLSGGIDSALVTALLQKESSTKLRTFTVGFEDSEFDESAQARETARYLGTQHTEILCSKENTEGILDDFSFLYDEPFADTSTIPTHLVSRLTRQYVKVALSGDGGDELFGGYTRFSAAERLGKLSRFPFAKKSISLLINLVPTRMLGSVMKNKFSNIHEKAIKLRNAFSSTGSELSELYDPMISVWQKKELATLMAKQGKPSSMPHGDIFSSIKQMSVSEMLMVYDMITYLPDDILAKVDRASMGAGLESREPFLSPSVIEYSFRLPARMKLRGNQGKYILRKILEKHLPQSYFNGPKQGFGMQFSGWFRERILTLSTDYLSEENIQKTGYFNFQEVKKCLNSYLSDPMMPPGKIWSLLVFQMWHRRWM